MIDRQYGKLTFECDSCPEYLETGESDFELAKQKFDNEGWEAEKIGADWVHTCDKCSK